MELAVGGIVATCPHCNGSHFRPAPEAGDFTHCKSCGRNISLNTLLAHMGAERIAREAQLLGAPPPSRPQPKHGLFFDIPRADLVKAD